MIHLTLRELLRYGLLSVLAQCLLACASSPKLPSPRHEWPVVKEDRRVIVRQITSVDSDTSLFLGTTAGRLNCGPQRTDEGDRTCEFRISVERYADLWMEVDVRQESQLGSAGILFGFQDSLNFHVLEVSRDTFAVRKKQRGVWWMLVKGRLSRREEAEKNHLKLVCNGPDVIVHLNEDHLGVVADRSYDGGQIGLFACKDEGTAVRFENMLLVSPPENARTERLFTAMDHYRIARYHHIRGMVDKAMARYDKAISVNHDSVASAYSYTGLGRILENRGLFGGSLEHYEKASAYLPNFVEPLVRAGDICHHRGMYAEAASCYRKAVTATQLKDVAVHRKLARAYRLAGMYNEADEAYRRVISLDTGRNVSLEAHLELGRMNAERGMLDRALRQYEAALFVDPNSYSALYEIGLIHQKKGHPESAASTFQRFLQLAEKGCEQPDLIARARTYLENFRAGKIRRHWEAGVAGMQAQKWLVAIREFDAVLHLDRTHRDAADQRLDAYYQQAVEYARQGKTPGASRYLDRVIAVDSSPQRTKKVAQCYYEMGIHLMSEHRKRAKEFLEKAKALNPDLADSVDTNVSTLYAMRTRDLYKEGAYKDAEEVFQKAIARDSTNYMAYLIYGKACVDRRHFEKAIGLLEKAREYNVGSDAEVFYRLAKCYDLPQTDRKQAIALYSRAVACDVHFAEAYFHRGLLFRIEGKKRCPRRISNASSMKFRESVSTSCPSQKGRRSTRRRLVFV